MTTKTTYFKDRRSGAVYTVREKTLPTSGSIPLRAAYKEDTVWIDRQHLDVVPDPHRATTSQSLWTLFMIVAWLAVWVFTSRSVAYQNHMHFADALVHLFGWVLLGYAYTARLTGLSHG